MNQTTGTITLDEAWAALRAEAGRGGRASDRIEIRAEGWSAGGVVDESAARLLDALAPVAASGKSLVVGQLGQSLDGRIATESGHSHTINGPEALVHLHRLRALVDAVIVGVGTAAADHPRLTVRHVDGRDPVRVVIDPSGRAPEDASPLGGSCSPTRTLHLVGETAEASAAPADHVERVVLPVGEAGMTPSALLAALAERGLRRVLIEGGAVTLSRFIDAGELDRLHLLVAPMLMGSGRCGLQLRVIDTVDEALRVPCRRSTLGDDTLFDLDLRAARRQAAAS